MPNYKKNTDFHIKTIHFQRDTIIDATGEQDTTRVQQDTLNTTRDTIRDTAPAMQEPNELSLEQIDSLLRENEKKEKQFEQARNEKIQPKITQQPKEQEVDSIADLYEIFGVTEMPISARMKDDPSSINFLYTIPVYAKQDTQAASSVFLHTEEKQQQEPQMLPREKNNTPSAGADWVIYFIAGIFLLMGWTRIFYRKYFEILMKGIFFFNYAQSLFSERNSLTIRASMLLNLSYFLTLGLFSFQSVEYYYPDLLKNIPPILLFSVLTGFFIAWYLWNGIFTRFIGFVFLRSQSFRQYLHNYNLYRKLQGIALFPAVIIIQFIAMEWKEPLLIIGSILFATAYFMHIARGLQLFLKNNVSIFYLILYLCALEFLPLFLLIEAIRVNFM